MLKLEIACLSEDLVLSELRPERLRFHLRGQGQHIFSLYQLLFNDLIRVAVVKPGTAATTTLLPPTVVQPVGFERDQGMLPYPPQSFIGYRLLSEFFAFPQKFLFFDLTGAYFWTFANAALFGAVNLAIVATLYLTFRQRAAAIAA